LNIRTAGQSQCFSCPEGGFNTASSSGWCALFRSNSTSSSFRPATTKSVNQLKETTFSNVTSAIVIIFQFKAPYQLSEITDSLRGKMVLAIANMLEVNAKLVVLEFSSSVSKRDILQQAGVLVSVGLINFHEPLSILATRITQENINAKMAAEGLMAVLLIVISPTGISWVPG
jgi:hypothetical protein